METIALLLFIFCLIYDVNKRRKIYYYIEDNYGYKYQYIIFLSASENNIELILKTDIDELLNTYPTYYSEVEIEKDNRYSIERVKREININKIS